MDEAVNKIKALEAAQISAREKAAQMAAAQLKEHAIKEEIERRVSLACVAIFAVLNFALFALGADFIYGGVNLKYAAPAMDAAIILMIIARRDAFSYARIFFALGAGFYSYLFFCQNLRQAAILNAAYWLSGALFTMRMKAALSVLFLIASEALYVALIRAVIERL